MQKSKTTNTPQASGASHAQSATMNRHGKPDDDQARGANSQTTLLLLACLALAACDRGATSPPKPACTEHGELRHTYFLECMKLSAQPSHNHEDDNGHAAEACSNQGYYMANDWCNSNGKEIQ